MCLAFQCIFAVQICLRFNLYVRYKDNETAYTALASLKVLELGMDGVRI
jgi:hypothetical protein